MSEAMKAKFNALLVGLLGFVFCFSNGFAKATSFDTSCIKLDRDGYLWSSITGCILEEIEKLATNLKIESKRIEGWDTEERLQRILVPEKGKDFPNLLIRVRQCTSSRSNASCADTGGYKKWKNEAVYSFRDKKYEKQLMKVE